MEQYIVDLLPYRTLQEKVLANEKAIEDGTGTNDIVVPAQGSESNPSTFVESIPGLVKLYNESSGLRLANERLCIASATKDEIDAGTSHNKPIVPETIKYAMQSKSFKGDIDKILESSADANTPPSAFSIRKFVLKYALNFKMTTIEKGGTFTITPGMIALVFPYGDYTLSAHKEDGTEIASSMGTSMIFSVERDAEWENDYWMAVVYAKNAVIGATVSSNHNRYSTNCYIKNNYSGNDGTGRAYVYYLSAN
jgi:hypothetical protein